MRLSNCPERYETVDAGASATAYADAPAGKAMLIRNVSSLVVINAALVISFGVFPLLQEALLIRLGTSSARHALTFHAVAVALVLSYSLLAERSSSYRVFPPYWTVLLLIGVVVIRNRDDLRAYMGKAPASARR